MASRILDAIAHPVVHAGNARWKARRLREAFRKTWLEAPEWVRACNRRREVLDYGPVNIFLEAASGCNLRCPMCPTGAGKITRKHGFLKPELARKLAGEIRHRPEQVGLWLGGEPLLNRELPEIVRILAEKHRVVSLHTNATLLTIEDSRALIEAGLGFVSFSFDAQSPEEYARLRPGGDYEATLENIRAFLRVKRERGIAKPVAVIQTIQKYLGEDIHPYGVQLETPPQVRELFAGLPVDEFRCIIANDWSGQLADSPFTAPDHAGIGRRMACRIPYTDLTIAWNGDAVTCCGDLDAKGILGNLYEENLYDLWNNERFRKFRRAMHTSEIERHPLCGYCERLWTKPHPLDYELRLALLRYRLRF